MTGNSSTYRLVISGGGTGGHIFPALAIANEFRFRHPSSEILFVGAKGRMEMSRVPEAGYKIIGLWISGLQRSLTLSNLLFPVKLLMSYLKALDILKNFKPHAVIGTGGYASGPVMLAAIKQGIPTLIQEQNSFAGLTNRKLADKVNTICVAYEGMTNFFPASKVRLTGNPVRKNITASSMGRDQAIVAYGLDPAKKTVLVFGGSLGALTLNNCVAQALPVFEQHQVQVIWQTGKRYYADMSAKLQASGNKVVKAVEFIGSMDEAYAAADIIVSRAGALSISELCLVGKPVILVPSPNVADDHQTKNALSMVSRSAAVLVSDQDATHQLVPTIIELTSNSARQMELSNGIRALGRPDATAEIVDEIEKLIELKTK